MRRSLTINPTVNPALKVRGRTYCGNLFSVELLRPVAAFRMATIVSGAVAERIRFQAFILFSLLLVALADGIERHSAEAMLRLVRSCAIDHRAALRELLDRGQPLERVLPAFTSNPADLLRLPDKGRIEAGGDADLVVLNPDGEMTDVMALGRWHVVDGRAVVRGTFEDLR